MGYAAIKHFVTHVHVKDAVVRARRGRSPNGPWSAAARSTTPARSPPSEADGYPGYLSLETHWAGPGGTKEASSAAPVWKACKNC